MATPRIALDREKIAAFCRKWHITELALFGSVLRDDFRPDSDVDVLVAFAPDYNVDFPSFLDMKEELEVLFGRPVDLLTKRSVEASRNPIRRHRILGSAQSIYDAAA